MNPDFLVYCERLGPGLWAEPVNLISNTGFLIAGTWALNRCRRIAAGPRESDLWILALLMLSIGVGSALWHSFHAAWAKSLDIVPILLFIHLYLYSFLRRQVGIGAVAAVGLTALFFAGSKAFGSLVDPDLLNGSVFYAPALATLAALVAWSHIRGTLVRRAMTAAFILLCASLVFRTLDLEVCASIPVGTHFLWHLTNAVVLAVLFSACARPGTMQAVHRV